MGYNLFTMNKIILLEPFSKWLRKLKDPIAKARIISRLEQAKRGNFGDSKAISSNIHNFFEMRISVSAGYRLYYFCDGINIYVVAYGGSKSSQQKDIIKAEKIISTYKLQEQEENDKKN